jgi:mannonate dehydratase
MEKTWRWFGKGDSITLDMLKQIGVEGIVTALHDVPNGEVWSVEAISDLQQFIETHRLRWSVVESLPVSEAIKYGGVERDRLIENYRQSLINLGQCGIHTVCYNFMPAIDWIRTDLMYPLPDGSYTLYFDRIRLAYFDLKILKRRFAESAYTPDELLRVEMLDAVITPAERADLIDAIILKTQGFVNGNISADEEEPIEHFKALLARYFGMRRDMLRQNLVYFLEAVMPVCDAYDINLCIHPDDPPYSLLGLPRIVTGAKDIRWILNAVNNPHNGLTFCAGSLSAGKQNDTRFSVREFVARTHFVHLRSTQPVDGDNFMESSHLSGCGHLIDLIRVFEREKPFLPMRVDHGRLMLGDEQKDYNPGYSFHGRMFALAQVEGMMTVIKHELRFPRSHKW